MEESGLQWPKQTAQGTLLGIVCFWFANALAYFLNQNNGNNAEDEPYILTSFEALNTNVSNANLTIPLDDGTGTSWGLGVLNWWKSTPICLLHLREGVQPSNSGLIDTFVVVQDPFWHALSPISIGVITICFHKYLTQPARILFRTSCQPLRF